MRARRRCASATSSSGVIASGAVRADERNQRHDPGVGEQPGHLTDAAHVVPGVALAVNQITKEKGKAFLVSGEYRQRFGP